MELEFEWHTAKAEANLRRHGVSFDLAKTVFKDPFAVELLDDREDCDEERFCDHRHGPRQSFVVCGVHRAQERIRIISARRATQYEQDDYFQQNA